MTPEAIREAVDLLIAARGDFRRIDGLPASCAPATVADGYAIQNAFAERWGAGTAGWKIGCTAVEQQRFIGVDEPFAGHVFAGCILDSPAEVSAGAFHLRGVETEFAFRMGASLPPREAAYSEPEVADAAALLHPAIEIVDSRLTDWANRGGPMIIADNGANGALVLGRGIEAWRGLDLGAHKAETFFGDEKVGEGTGALALGHPVTALTWLANHLSRSGIGLGEGQVVTTGTIAGFHPAPPGTHARADFGALGTVEVTFTV